jgi:hypothetical protein
MSQSSIVKLPAAQQEVVEHLKRPGMHVYLFGLDMEWGGTPWCEHEDVMRRHHHTINLNTWRAMVKRGLVEEYERQEPEGATPVAFYRLTDAVQNS